MAKAIKKFVVV